MKCKEFIELIHDGVDGELTGESVARFRGHARDCESCGNKAESVRRIKKLVQVKARTEVAPAGLERLVRQRLDSEPLSRSLPYRGLVAAAFLLGLVIFLVARDWSSAVPEIAHALAVEQAVEKSERESSMPVAQLRTSTRRLLNAMPNPDLFEDGDMEVLGWSEETLGDDEIPAIRIQVSYKGEELVCFAFRAHLTMCPTPDDKHVDPVEETPSEVCMCKRTADGKTVICYQLANCEGIHMITVLHPKLARLLSDDHDSVGDLKKVLVAR